MATCTIYRPSFTDIPEIMALMKRAHKRSRYADRCGVDVRQGKAVLLNAMFTDMEKDDSTAVLVAKNAEGRICGVLAGARRPLYEALTLYMAMDVIFVVDEDAPARAAGALLDAFHDWATRPGGTVILRHGVNDAISDPDRVSALFQRRGFRRAGYIFEKEVTT